MTEVELEELKDLIGETHRNRKIQIAEALEQHGNGEHHQFIEAMIAKEKRSQERIERIQGNIFFYLFVTTTSMMGLAVWHFFIASLKGDAND